MAGRTRKVEQETNSPGASGEHLEKLTRLIALLVVKGESQSEKIKALSGAGFSNSEIADLLGISANAVNVAMHRLRKRKQ